MGLGCGTVNAFQRVRSEPEGPLKDEVRRPPADLVRRVLNAGADAARVALEAGQRATGDGVATYVRGLREAEPATRVDDLVDRVVRAHVTLARAEGAAAGVATSAVQATTIVGSAGTLTLPSAVLITATDLTGLLWIQLHMTLIVSALYGHDPSDPARIHEFLSLQDAMPATAGPAVSAPLAKAAGRVSRRLLIRYLRGPLLTAVTSLFRAVGIKFTRAALVRQFFLLNIPVNAMVNDVATRRLAHKARGLYKTLPAVSRLHAMTEPASPLRCD